MNLFVELRRRNVLRAGVLYAGAVWALAQGIAQLGPYFSAPEWTVRWFVIAACVGFPFWIAFAWFYELTPQGLKRESEIAPDDSIARSTGRKLDKWIIAVLALAVVLLITNQFVLDRGASGHAQSAGAVDAALAKVPAKSIAVLPFVNMSGDAKNDYFSDGITEEILNALAQIPKLKVAARTSAFAFKGKEEDLRKVGQVLDVATVLEGSVQKSGDEVRITAQLIDTRTGYHLWSEKYDRKLTSIFAVEDEISKAIADKLRVQLAGNGRTLVAQTDVDPRAHDLYLRGLTLLAGRKHLRDAVGDFRQALAIAPHYAQAWAKLAQTYMLLPWYEHENVETALADAQGAVEHALTLKPDNASGWAARGMIDHMRWRWASADKAFRRALQLAPGDAEVINQYAQFLSSAGQFDAALSEFRKAQTLDPLSPAIAPGLIQNLLAMHRYAEAESEARAALATYPDTPLSYSAAMKVAIYRGRYAEAEAYARRDVALAGSDAGVAQAIAKGVSDPEQRAAAVRAIESYVAEGTGLYHAASGEWLAVLGTPESALASLERFAARGAGVNEGVVWAPAFDPVRNDPRFQAVLKKMGLPYRPTETGSP